MAAKKKSKPPTKKTLCKPTVYEPFLRAVSQGLSLKSSAAIAGVNPKTVRNWVKRGEDGEPDYELFALKYHQAMAGIEAQLVTKVAEADDWRSASWLLEKRMPKEYGALATHKVEVTAKPAYNLEKMSLAERKQLLKLMDKAKDE